MLNNQKWGNGKITHFKALIYLIRKQFESYSSGFQGSCQKNVFRTKWVDSVNLTPPSSVPPFCQADVLLTTSLSYKGGIPEHPGVGLLEQTDPDPGRHLGNPVTRRFVHLLTWYWLFSKQNGSKMLDSIAVLLLHIRVAYHILQAFLSSTSLETIVMISGGFCMGHTAWVAEGRIRRSQRVLVEYDWLRWWEQQHRTAGFVDYCQSVVIIIVSLHHVYYTISVVHTYTKVWNLSSKRLKCFHQSHLKKYSDYRKVSTKITWLIHLLRPIPWNGKRMFRYDIKDFRFDN